MSFRDKVAAFLGLSPSKSAITQSGKIAEAFAKGMEKANQVKSNRGD